VNIIGALLLQVQDKEQIGEVFYDYRGYRMDQSLQVPRLVQLANKPGTSLAVCDIELGNNLPVTCKVK
jgi:hypothetical protein